MINDSEIVTKKNCLIEANFTFSLNEYRILLYGISLINPVQNEFPSTFTIDIRRFSEIYNLDVNGLYNDIKQSIVNRFFNRRFTLKVEDDKKVLCHLLETLTYHDKSGLLTLKFSQNSIPFLHKLKDKFTSYYISQIVKFKSIYSIRLYEFCIMEVNRAKLNEYEFILELEEIKKRLCLCKKYSRYYNLKQRVLTSAKTEINAYSDLTIDFEEIKKGRTVESIKFTVQRKEGAKPARYQRIEETKELDNTPKPVLPTAEEMAQEMSKQSMKERLINFGITEKVANKFIQKYSDRYIEQHIDYTLNKMKQGSVTNSAAFLVDVINHGYAI